MIIIGVISSLTTVFVALESKKLFDSAQYGKIDPLIRSGLAIIGIVLLQTIMQSLLTIYSSKISTSLANKLRQKLFEKLSRVQWIGFSKFHSGDLLTRMTSDIDTVVNGITSVVPGMISFFFTLCASIVVLAVFDPLLALFAFILGPLTLIFTKLYSNKLSEYHLRIQETESKIRGFIQECLKNMHIVKSFRLEGESSSTLSNLHGKKLGWVIRRSKVNAVSSAILTLGYWLGFLLATLWGSIQLSKGNATFGTITVYLQLVGQIQAPFEGLAYSIPQVIVMYASAGRLIKLYELEDESMSGETPQWSSAGIHAEELEFRYDEETVILKNTSFDIKPGELVAVVGASGEGKTTLIRLLLSLLKPSRGTLCYYNPDTHEKINTDTVTRSLASYVPQGNTLFSGTIAENVMLGNKEAGMEEMIKALKDACIWDFIDSLPDKADTVLGENGYGLSEGQAQRISIARALLSKKPVLILDEATSALDSETELEVLRSIASIKPLPTCIIITHRKAALDFCSRILKIENGCISE
ncbi:MAG TPA: ABC transporter ATP-binding protein [Clostridia bacterium]|nr:ABC transporter ATP-binding protein [Clostridia bacterium]